MPNTIKLKSYNDVIIERDANATITPGMLIELMSTNKVRAHASEGQNMVPMIALENALEGEDINDNYAANDKVQIWIPTRGDEAYMILEDGENVVIGDLLESNGAGYLQKHVADVESFESAEPGSITVYPNQTKLMALEAKDLSGSSGEEESSDVVGYNKRIRVMVL